ncbi:hypothetical protein QYF61_026196 [Mycteria americana]|uniref:Endonuclease/exonuclease/phosphatase domain-containing protein n=1 Tax=Mycteria americana TaxID=33587 RepID=A0AAN7N0C3_MYCAM|nr:hypothetical protein QYF61_026196 [Mycteria americana]
MVWQCSKERPLQDMRFDAGVNPSVTNLLDALDQAMQGMYPADVSPRPAADRPVPLCTLAGGTGDGSCLGAQRHYETQKKELKKVREERAWKRSRRGHYTKQGILALCRPQQSPVNHCQVMGGDLGLNGNRREEEEKVLLQSSAQIGQQEQVSCMQCVGWSSAAGAVTISLVPCGSECRKPANSNATTISPAPCLSTPTGGIVLLGDFNHPDICWKSSTASYKKSRRLLECMEDNFLSQVIDSPTRGDVILDLLVTNTSEQIGDVKIGGSLGCSDRALVEFAVLRDMGQAKSKVRTVNFRKAKFQLFKECKKSGKEGKRPAWMSQDLLVKLKGKMEMHRQWKQGQIPWEEHRDTAWLCRDGVRKAKAQLELNLARDAKTNKKGFCRYVGQKRKVKERVPP